MDLLVQDLGGQQTLTSPTAGSASINPSARLFMRGSSQEQLPAATSIPLSMSEENPSHTISSCYEDPSLLNSQ